MYLNTVLIHQNKWPSNDLDTKSRTMDYNASFSSNTVDVWIFVRQETCEEHVPNNNNFITILHIYIKIEKIYVMNTTIRTFTHQVANWNNKAIYNNKIYRVRTVFGWVRIFMKDFNHSYSNHYTQCSRLITGSKGNDARQWLKHGTLCTPPVYPVNIVQQNINNQKINFNKDSLAAPRS